MENPLTSHAGSVNYNRVIKDCKAATFYDPPLSEGSIRTAMPAFEVYLKDRLFWRYSFAQEEIRIGRSNENDVVLADSIVSRLHAIVQRREGKYVLMDQSTNGTFVNNEGVDLVVLSDQDHIKIGDYSLIYLSDPSPQKMPEDTRLDQTATIIHAYDGNTNNLTIERFFLLFHQEGKTQKFPIDKTRVRIGNARENDIQIRHPSVSRYHAVIEYRQDQFYLNDLNSAEGTRVQGRKVKEGILKPGHEIHFGKVLVNFASSTQKTTLSPSRESPFAGMVGQSPAMASIYSLIKRVSASNISILIQGDTGSGKELVARAIHALSDRCNGPLIILNCGAIPRNLVESEFFGHKKGAFTGADADRVGAFERADGGTVFLDEIGELPLELQPRLLRVLEDKAVTRVGGNKLRPADFRLIAATNRRMEDEVRKGSFRQDLFYRISVVPVTLPPLCERKEDIPVLVEHFLSLKADEIGKEASFHKITNQAKTKLMMHDWPGNVRELRNVIERAVLMTDGNEITAEDLSFVPVGRDEVEESLMKGDLSLEEVEKKVILHTLKAHNGDKKTTADVLGVAYSTLWAKMKKYNITV